MADRKWRLVIKLELIGIIVCLGIIAFNIWYAVSQKDPRHHTAEAFETAFNERMGDYGMSLDISSPYAYAYSGSAGIKTSEIACSDGSLICCRLAALPYSHEMILVQVQFEQPVLDEGTETIYLQPLTEMLLNVFEPPMAADHALGGRGRASYNDVMTGCNDVLTGRTDEYEARICSEISIRGNLPHEDRIVLSRIKKDGQVFLLVHLSIGIR